MLIRVFLVVTAVTLTASGLWSLLRERPLQLEDVRVEVEAPDMMAMVEAKVSTQLQNSLASFHGKSLSSIAIQELMNNIKSDQRIRDVQIFRQWPNQLRLRVFLHEPALMILTSAGQLLPVASDGSLLPAVSWDEALDTPVLRGDHFLRDISLRHRAVSIVHSLPETGLISRQSVSEISYDSHLGFKLFVSSSLAEILLGQDHNPQQWSRIEQVLMYLNSQNLKGRVIDASFKKKVVVRLRNAP